MYQYFAASARVFRIVERSWMLKLKPLKRR
jgi:hypothetical protein